METHHGSVLQPSDDVGSLSFGQLFQHYFLRRRLLPIVYGVHYLAPPPSFEHELHLTGCSRLEPPPRRAKQPKNHLPLQDGPRIGIAPPNRIRQCSGV